MSAILKALPLPRGRQVSLQGAQTCLNLFPRRTGERSRVYAIAFAGGVVKIGRSSTPRSRLRDHWNRGAGEVQWVHLFAPMHPETAAWVEKRATDAVREFLKPVHGSEWYRGETDKARVVAAVRDCIDFCRADMQKRFKERAADAAKRAEAERVLKKAGITGVHVSATWYRTPSEGEQA